MTNPTHPEEGPAVRNTLHTNLSDRRLQRRRRQRVLTLFVSGVTDGSGLFTFDVPSTAPEGLDAIRYRVTVTNGSDQAVVDVRDAPARGQSRERVTVRI